MVRKRLGKLTICLRPERLSNTVNVKKNKERLIRLFHILLSLSSSCLLSWIILQILPSKVVARYCQLATAIINNSEQYSNARSLLASTFCLPSEEVAISAANYNYNHYNLPFSHIMIIVIISDEDTLCKQIFRKLFG